MGYKQKVCSQHRNKRLAPNLALGLLLALAGVTRRGGSSVRAVHLPCARLCVGRDRSCLPLRTCIREQKSAPIHTLYGCMHTLLQHPPTSLPSTYFFSFSSLLFLPSLPPSPDVYSPSHGPSLLLLPNTCMCAVHKHTLGLLYCIFMYFFYI